MMNITVNDEEKQLDTVCSIEEGLTKLGIPTGPGMAVAINSEVVPKNRWPHTLIQAEDNLIVIRAAQGG